MDTKLGARIAAHFGVHLNFPQANCDRVAHVRDKTKSFGDLEKLNEQLKSVSKPCERYQIEYREQTYHSYKPGIDDGFEAVLGYPLSSACVVELGGGPSYLARQAHRGVCLDLFEHPEVAAHDVEFFERDICIPQATVDAIDSLNRVRDDVDHVLVVLSYCLDRVPDQKAALSLFCRLVNTYQAQGLITVCLPTKPSSLGRPEINYARDWVTPGKDAVEDYEVILRACCEREDPLHFSGGGRTLHFGASLDGFECLDCYVMLFSPERARTRPGRQRSGHPT